VIHFDQLMLLSPTQFIQEFSKRDVPCVKSSIKNSDSRANTEALVTAFIHKLDDWKWRPLSPATVALPERGKPMIAL
jgi:hypothetical protein